MKLNKKKVLVAALAISLIAIMSLGSLAWFNAKDDVTNTFLTADSNQDADDVFSIDVWEEVDADSDGTVDSDIIGDDEIGGSTTYTKVLPGDVLIKKPYVENTGSYDQWVRVYVTLSDAAQWKSFVKEGTDLASIFTVASNFDDVWKRGEIIDKSDDASVNTITYVYYLQSKLAPGEANKVGLFTAVTIPTWLTQQNMVDLGTDGFYVNVKAEAVQADNTGTSAKEAFTNVGWEAGTEYDYVQP